MGGVDHRDQHSLMGAGFKNVAHFGKWYKKAFLGLTDFSLLQVFMAWNLAVNSPERPIRGGQPKIRDMKKWEFYSIDSEEMVTYLYKEENQNFERVQTETPMHTPTPVTNSYHTKIPIYIIYSMEEVVVRGVKSFENK